MENDLISRSAVIEEIEERISDIAFSSPYQDEIESVRDGMQRALNSVENAPAVDAVEVVRCKDCVCWMYEYDDVGLCVTDVAPVDDGIDGVQRLAMDFCSYGERRADDGK